MRIDNYLSTDTRFGSRNKAKEAVERGEVLVNGKRVKPSYNLSDNDIITFASNAGAYVSNGAFKLIKAIDNFNVSLKDKIIADIGASTGGFTQVCLENGAKKVYAVDVGNSLLHPSILSDERVVVLDNTNARFIDENTFGKVDFIVTDVSFISLTLILPVFSKILVEKGEAIVLIKPQFECGAKALSKNGIVTDVKNRIQACLSVISCAEELGFGCVNIATAPEREGKNVEYLLHLKKSVASTLNENFIKSFCIKM